MFDNLRLTHRVHALDWGKGGDGLQENLLVKVVLVRPAYRENVCARTDKDELCQSLTF